MSQSDESHESFTDDEAAFLRHVRFGALPPRVQPADYVEVTETDPPARGLLMTKFEMDGQAILYAGG
ncbi:MAG: hypothetical protein V7637_3320 [Mycobacteriales bacterium]|jgi:hypothetical protein